MKKTKITIYSSNNCNYCKLTKDYLTNKDVAYEEKNISEDREAKKTLIMNGLMAVPVIEFEEDGKVEFYSGYVPTDLDSIISRI